MSAWGSTAKITNNEKKKLHIAELKKMKSIILKILSVCQLSK